MMRKILLWVEMIAGLRVLLFTVPVLLQTQSSPTPELVWEYRFVWLLTAVAGLYIVVGAVSLLGGKAWGVLHAAAAAVTLAAGGIFLMQARSAVEGVPPYFGLPLAVGVVFGAAALLVSKDQSQLA